MAAEQASPVNDLRECPVCLDDMINKSPKILECKHSYCISCLSGLAVEHGTSGFKIPCPKCKHNTMVHSGKLSDLPDNFLLQEVKAVLDDHSRYYYCFYCNKVDKDTRAVCQCITCHRYMCGDCSEKHKKTPKFMKHEIIIVTEEKYKEYCQKHNEPVAYVCIACSPIRLICDVCMMLDTPCHPDKNLLDYTTVLSKEESNLRSKVVQEHNVDKLLSERRDKRLEELTKVKDTAVFIIKGIERAVENVISEIEEARSITSLKLASDGVKKAKAEATQLLKDDKKQLENIREADGELFRALENYTREEEITTAKAYNLDKDSDMWRELLGIKQSVIHMLKEGPKMVLCWHTNGIVSKLRASRDGRVLYVCKESSVITHICPEGTQQQMDTKHLEYGGNVTGVDICDDVMLIVCSDPPVSASYKCKLSSDLTQVFPVLSEMKEMNVYMDKVTELCVCDADNIFLTWADGSMWKYDIKHGTSDKIAVPYYNEKSFHLTRFCNDDQPGLIVTYEMHQAVLLQDTTGRPLREISKASSLVKHPRATTVNAEGNILVADSGTCKIVEVTSKGKFVRYVLTKEDGLENPVSVVYSHPYLWVADQKKGIETILKCFKM